MMENVKNSNDYKDKIHRVGRITGILALTLIILVPLLTCLKFGIFPPIKNLIEGIVSVWLIFLPVGVIEYFTYSPILGPGATYLVFITGNLTNLKIPCATMSMDLAQVKPFTKEADIIATISVAASALVTELMILITVLAIRPLTPILSSPALAPAFDNILPALFGGLGVYWISKQWKISIVPLTISIVLSFIFNINVSILMPIAAIFSVLAARLMYKKGFVTDIK